LPTSAAVVQTVVTVPVTTVVLYCDLTVLHCHSHDYSCYVTWSRST